MGDRKLVSLFPDAVGPQGGQAFLDRQIKEYLEISGGKEPEALFFNMEPYSNPIGIEIEAEMFQGYAVPLCFWRLDEDLSLKKKGIEFISYPLTGRAIDYALEEARLAGGKLSYSHRTSVHVHCNVMHYTTNQLATLMAYYAMLETCFYHQVDYIRWGNTFCYPLVGTKPEVAWYSGHEGEIEKTTKYCAFNIAPVRTQFSVEFRHMHGTANPKILRRWIQTCAKLVYYVGKLNPKTCIQDTIDVINAGKFKDVVPLVWGDTAEIFDRRIIDASIKNGELWAMVLLTGLA